MPVPSGDAFTDTQLREISRAVHAASAETGVHFSVFIGSPEGNPREYAERLHTALGPGASNAVLILVAPGERVLEIVTGRDVTGRVPDRSCALAALSMTSAFAGGDLAGGIVTGLRMLADAAGQARAITGGQPAAPSGVIAS